MDEKEKLSILRHSAAHLLAHAVMELYPNTKLTIGPATEDGFFYDCLPEENFKEEDLEKIESRMKEISARHLPIEHKEIPKAEARKIYKDNPFKLELIDGIEGETVGMAYQGDFYDLCRGGHVESTGKIKHFKLLHVSGAYWRADKDNTALQRIYGTAFFDRKELKKYLQMREDALKYDHRKLGKELDLFSFHHEGTGFPFFHPHGKTVLNVLENFLRTTLSKADYKEIQTPMMLSDKLWRTSGHYEHYKDNMYFCGIGEEKYAVKPMNCPGAILIYKERPHSYRELPMRLAEFGHVHRYELSGVLHGLFRARSFTIDDAHIFCTEDQIEQELRRDISITYNVLQSFGFEEIKVHLATKPENAMGSDELWKKAIAALENALEGDNIPFEVHEGDGAFYGPKIEFHILDSMGRSWQCGTTQLDFFLPQNFDLSYISHEGKKEQPVLIHHAVYGSFERFFGILLEHFKGRLPFWLAPVQATVLTITDEQKPYATQLLKHLQAQGIRATIDQSSDPISGQIKSAQLQQIPWMLVVGNKEMENSTITLRTLDGKQQFGLSLEDLMSKAQELNKQIN